MSTSRRYASKVGFKKPSSARNISPDESAFITAYGHALSHAIIVLAADPDIKVSEGSTADRLQRSFGRSGLLQKRGVKERAAKLLSAPIEERRRYFGDYADLGPEAWSNATPGLDPKARDLLQRAVRSKLDSERVHIENSLKINLNAATKSLSLINGGATSVEIGYFHGEFHLGYKELTINQPQVIQVRWQTTEPNAEIGRWELFRAGSVGKQDTLIAEGNAGSAPMKVFDIDLGKYLPATPSIPTEYFIRVTPYTSTTFVPVLPSGVKVGKLGKAVGPPSEPAVITYTGVVAPPPKFDFYERYGYLSICFDSITMVDDSNEWGVEKFHVTGFAANTSPLTSDKPSQKITLPSQSVEEIDPDAEDKTEWLYGCKGFDLTDYKEEEDWPRLFTVVISVLEEDDGDQIAAWQTAIWDAATSDAFHDAEKFAREYLDDVAQDLFEKDLDTLINIATNIASYIAGAVLSLINPWVGLAVGVALLIVVLILALADNEDEYCGLDVQTLVLPSNSRAYVEGLPGQITSSKKFRMNEFSLNFYGAGEQEVKLHWEFSNMHVY